MERDQELVHKEPDIGLYHEGNKNYWSDLLVMYSQTFLLEWQLWLQCGKWIRVTLDIKGKYLWIYCHDPKI